MLIAAFGVMLGAALFSDQGSDSDHSSFGGLTDNYSLRHQKGAAKFAVFAESTGRMILKGPGGSDPVQDAGSGRVFVEITGGPLSLKEVSYLSYLGETLGLSQPPFANHMNAPLDHQTMRPAGPNTVRVFFDL